MPIHNNELLLFQLNYCLKKIENMLGISASREWQTKDFQKLSKLIQQKSGYAISVSTLKRVWGRVHYNFFPSHYTLSILTSALGYQSWDSFIKDQQQEINQFVQSNKTKDLITEQNKQKKSTSAQTRRILPKKWWLLLISTSVIIGGLLLIVNINKPENYTKIIQSVEDTINVIPFSTKIHYNLSALDQEAYLHVLTRKFKLSPEANFHNTRVMHPGYKTYSLYIDNTKTEEFRLLGLTNGWHAVIKDKKNKRYSYYLSDLIKQDGVLQMADSAIENIINFQEFQSLQYINVSDFQVQGSAFELEIKFKYRDIPRFHNYCQHIIISVLDKNTGYISAQFSKNPCTSSTYLKYGNKRINGKTSDIPFMNINTTEWNTARIINKDGQFQLFVNDSLRLNDQNQEPLKDIYIVKIIFAGGGMLDYVRLGDGEGNWAINDEF